MRWRIWQADLEVRAVTRSEQARYLALAKAKIERRKQRECYEWQLGRDRLLVVTRLALLLPANR